MPIFLLVDHHYSLFNYNLKLFDVSWTDMYDM